MSWCNGLIVHLLHMHYCIHLKKHNNKTLPEIINAPDNAPVCRQHLTPATGQILRNSA